MADAARARKVADRIHETVARLLQGRIKDPRLGFVTVTDVPKNAGFRLPLTGANGVIFLTVAGALLVAGGAVVAYANKRRHVAKH